MSPATSAVLGILLLHEAVSAQKLAGCAAIVLSIVLVALGSARAERPRVQALEPDVPEEPFE